MSDCFTEEDNLDKDNGILFFFYINNRMLEIVWWLTLYFIEQ